jgi:hypothetical protein
MEGGSLRRERMGYTQDALIGEHLSSPLFPFRLSFVSYSQGFDYPLSGGPRTMSVSVTGKHPRTLSAANVASSGRVLSALLAHICRIGSVASTLLHPGESCRSNRISSAIQ